MKVRLTMRHEYSPVFVREVQEPTFVPVNLNRGRCSGSVTWTGSPSFQWKTRSSVVYPSAHQTTVDSHVSLTGIFLDQYESYFHFHAFPIFPFCKSSATLHNERFVPVFATKLMNWCKWEIRHKIFWAYSKSPLSHFWGECNRGCDP